MKFTVGLMSGTSRDGIDAALIKTDGLRHVEPIAFCFKPYAADIKSLIADACEVAMNCDHPHPNAIIARCQTKLDEQHATVTQSVIEKARLSCSDISVVGLHGHTIGHRADLGWTWQIGDPQSLADALDINVMSDMRCHDVMFGGQGAPLIPVFHRALFADPTEPTVVLNLGGVANLTDIGPDNHLLAFDCGMANALIDDWMSQMTNYDYDEGGQFAAKGIVDESLLDTMLDDPFFAAAGPKSLDRSTFGLNPIAHLSPTNGAATLTAFSAKAVAIALNLLPARPVRLIVCGGGRKNKTMLGMIEEYSGLNIISTDDLGWDGDAIEAQGFAYLAYRCLYGLPITFPGTTGVSEPMSGGVLTKPDVLKARMVAA